MSSRTKLFEFSKPSAETSSNVSSPKAKALEAQGWRPFLKTCFPFAFEEEFSQDHVKFWDLFWSVILRIREQRKYLKLGHPIPPELIIPNKEFVTLLLLGRGLAKSSTLEASSVVRAALLGGGYMLYICEAQDQANEHLGNCKSLITHPESRLTEFYPHMAIDQGAIVNGIKARDREDLFVTLGGWIARAKGLNAGLRGIRVGTQRPDDINLDDLDAEDDSIKQSLNKLKKVTARVIPTQARHHVTIKVGQNIIIETGVVNSIHTGKSDALSQRTTIGVTNTFVTFERGKDYESYIDEEDGRLKHRILPAAQPTWPGVSIAQAQKFLDDSGLDTFLAEYQNEFEHLKQGRVVHAYDEPRHIITWSMFEKLTGCRFIPKHWHCELAGDIGYTQNSLSAWTFRATAAKNSPLAGAKFIYRGLVFDHSASIDDQAIALWTAMFPDDRIEKRHFEASTDFGAYPELLRILRLNPRLGPLLEEYELNPLEERYQLDWSAREVQGLLPETYREIAEMLLTSQIGAMMLSHEKSGEQRTLAQKYGLPVWKTKDFGHSDGVSQWNYLLRGDYTKPHPFKPDELKPDGTYKLGRPELYYIVDDDQELVARDDRGLKTHRQNILAWEYAKESLTNLGFQESRPMKYRSDTCDSERMLHAYSWGASAKLSRKEDIERRLPEETKTTTIAQLPEDEKSGAIMRRIDLIEKLEVEHERKNIYDARTRAKLRRRRGR